MRSSAQKQRDFRKGVVRAVGTIVLAAVLASCGGGEKKEEAEAAPETSGPSNEVTLAPESLRAAGVQVEPVAATPTSSLLRFTGAIEADQLQTQQVTPLVGGRIEQVHVSLGDRVRAGTTLALISSPEVAEMHGKLLEAQARLNLSESTLKRTEKLSALGASAGKDLAAAQAEVETARAEVLHLRNSLAALGAPAEETQHSIAAVVVRAPISGSITERLVNPGSGVEAAKPLFVIANLSRVWVIANVPESQVSSLRIGNTADVHSAVLGDRALSGKVTYIDPVLSEQTRTARVRIEVTNQNELLKVGMFADVTVHTTGSGTVSITVPDDAVQRIDDKDVVFVEKRPGTFEPRAVQLGDRFASGRVVLGGLKAGERIVTKGAFTVKSQLLKSQFAEGD